MREGVKPSIVWIYRRLKNEKIYELTKRGVTFDVHIESIGFNIIEAKISGDYADKTKYFSMDYDKQTMLFHFSDDNDKINESVINEVKTKISKLARKTV